MEINNPYTEKLQEAIRNEDKVNIDLYNKKSQEFIQKTLDSLKVKMLDVEDKIETFKETINTYPITKQYKESIELYRFAMGFVEQTRELKKEIREHMALMRKNKKN